MPIFMEKVRCELSRMHICILDSIRSRHCGESLTACVLESAFKGILGFQEMRISFAIFFLVRVDFLVICNGDFFYFTYD